MNPPRRINPRETLPRWPTKFPRSVKDLGESMMPAMKARGMNMHELYPRKSRTANAGGKREIHLPSGRTEVP